MDFKSFSDIELWRRHQKGDIEAYNVIFGRYAEPLYRYAKKWVKNDSDAEELVMDLFLNLWLKRSELNPDAGINLKAYFYRAMRNRVVNHFHKVLVKTESIENVSDADIADSRSADYPIRAKEIHETYLQSLKMLSPQRLKVFKMSREEGLTYRQIAERCNLSINTVENYMASALAILREHSKSWLPAIMIVFFSLFS